MGGAAAASQTAIQDELRIVWWVVDCLLFLNCGLWAAAQPMLRNEKKTRRAINESNQKWVNFFYFFLSGCWFDEWMKRMNQSTKRKEINEMNGAPSASAVSEWMESNELLRWLARAIHGWNEWGVALLFWMSGLWLGTSPLPRMNSTSAALSASASSFLPLLFVCPGEERQPISFSFIN